MEVAFWVGFFFVLGGFLFILIFFPVKAKLMAKKEARESAERRAQREREANEQIKRNQEREEGFLGWLEENQFVCSDFMGGEYDGYNYRHASDCFILDVIHKKWCQMSRKKIFDFSDMVRVKVEKHEKKVIRGDISAERQSSSHHNSTTNRYSTDFFIPKSKSKSAGERVGEGSYSKNESRVHEDESTYDVFIWTNDIANAQVTIPCGRSIAEANKIKATVESIIASVKTEVSEQKKAQGGQGKKGREENSDTQRLDVEAELLKYKKLLDSGLISQEDFDAKKKMLLGL